MGEGVVDRSYSIAFIVPHLTSLSLELGPLAVVSLVLGVAMLLKRADSPKGYAG